MNVRFTQYILFLLSAFYGFNPFAKKIARDTSSPSALVAHTEYPKTISELRAIVTAEQLIAIAGSNYSMGGQARCEGCTIIDLKNLNAITAFNPEERTITVQAGARWYEVQTFLQKHALTVMVMQSYNDFSVGGSIAVNVHSRDPHGQIIQTVLAITVMVADGSLITATKTNHAELFHAAIGGYGLCGIIVDVTLQLEDNYPIKRTMTTTAADEFPQFYQQEIAPNKDIAFFNANVQLPQFDEIISVIWRKTNEPLTITKLTQPSHPSAIKTTLTRISEYLVEFNWGQRLRFFWEKKINAKKKQIVWRSYEMSYSLASLTLNSTNEIKILQEYFIPIAQFSAFFEALKNTLINNNVRTLNVSIRHVPKDTRSLLAYAPQESFAFVCYIAIKNTPEAHEAARAWTQKIIDAALAAGGTYYLPYHLWASQRQFERAYPHFDELLEVKQKYDPRNIFQNTLFQTYR